MRPRNLVALAALLAMVSADPPKAVAANGGGAVWIVGDSIAVGVSQALRRRGFGHNAQAKSGTALRVWRSRVQGLGIKQGDLLVLSCGTNDWVSPVLREEFPAGILEVRQWADAHGIGLLWLVPPSPEVDLSQLDPAGQVSRLTLRELPMADRWHPTAEGYEEIAEAVVEAARP